VFRQRQSERSNANAAAPNSTVEKRRTEASSGSESACQGTGWAAQLRLTWASPSHDLTAVVPRGGHFVCCHLRHCARDCKTPAAVSILLSTKPFCLGDETTLKHRALIGLSARGLVDGDFPMFELTTAFFATFSVTIFLAHAIDAYMSR
jgi:hypothetical protein